MAKLLVNKEGKLLSSGNNKIYAISESSGSGGSSPGDDSNEELDSISYYKKNRNENYPYFPLPSEMTETNDVIYLLYDAQGYRCCPVFRVYYSDCNCTVYKYLNKELIKEETSLVLSGATKYLQYSKEDSDYNTYNYIVIKLQGEEFTSFSIGYYSKFNNIQYNASCSSELIEVSGKCQSCSIDVKYSSGNPSHRMLQYFSFTGIKSSSDTNLFQNSSSLKCIPELDTSNVTNMNNMFNGCNSLEVIPKLDTSNVTNMSSMFGNCYSLETIPELDTSNVTNMSNMFSGCRVLKSIPELNTSNVTNMAGMLSGCYILETIPELNTSKVTDMYYMFNNCYSLETIPKLDTSNVTDMSSMFGNCYNLQTIVEMDSNSATTLSSMFNKCYLLGEINLKNIKLTLNLSNSTMLSKEELIKIINNLATVSSTQTLTLGSTNLAKLTDDEKAIATNKGWSLA